MVSATNEDIEKRLGELEVREEKIEKEEREILETDQHILEELEQNKNSSVFTQILYKFRLTLSILLTIGVVLVWKGVGQISDKIPVVSTAVGALIVGILILFVINRLTKTR